MQRSRRQRNQYGSRQVRIQAQHFAFNPKIHTTFASASYDLLDWSASRSFLTRFTRSTELRIPHVTSKPMRADAAFRSSAFAQAAATIACVPTTT